MSDPGFHLGDTGSLWAAVVAKAADVAAGGFASTLVSRCVLESSCFSDALITRLALEFSQHGTALHATKRFLADAWQTDPRHDAMATQDLLSVLRNDPACESPLLPLLFFKGYLAIQTHRIAHVLHAAGDMYAAYHLQSLSSRCFQVDIHPAARLGAGITFDHATGIVIGETSTVGDDVTIMQGVTLGGTGKARGDRHPKVGDGVFLGVGCQVLGNIHLGVFSKIGAGSVVLNDVPDHATAVGVPAKVVRIGSER